MVDLSLPLDEATVDLFDLFNFELETIYGLLPDSIRFTYDDLVKSGSLFKKIESKKPKRKGYGYAEFWVSDDLKKEALNRILRNMGVDEDKLRYWSFNVKLLSNSFEFYSLASKRIEKPAICRARLSGLAGMLDSDLILVKKPVKPFLSEEDRGKHMQSIVSHTVMDYLDSRSMSAGLARNPSSHDYYQSTTDLVGVKDRMLKILELFRPEDCSPTLSRYDIYLRLRFNLHVSLCFRELRFTSYYTMLDFVDLVIDSSIDQSKFEKYFPTLKNAVSLRGTGSTVYAVQP